MNVRLTVKRSRVAALAIAVVATLLFCRFHSRQAFIDLTLLSDGPVNARLNFDFGTGFNDEDVVDARVTPGPGKTLLRFPVPSKKIIGFRLDPVRQKRPVILANLQVLGPGRETETIEIAAVLAVREVQQIAATKSGILISAAAGDTVPSILMAAAKPVDLRPGMRDFYLPAGLVAVSSFAASLLLLTAGARLHGRCLRWRGYASFLEKIDRSAHLSGSWVKGFRAAGRRLAGHPLYRWFVSTDRRELFWLSLAIFLIMTGSRFLVLENFGSDLPWFDAWGIEGKSLYKPFFQGTLTFGDFFLPCNEHRIVFTRLLTLGILLLNGIWDNLLQSVVNSLIYSVIAVWLFLAMGRHLGSGGRLLWALAVTVPFAFSHGWENTVWGFQSQFYLLAGVSMAALHLACTKGRNDFRYLALLGGIQVAALFTMASGVMASVAALVTYAAVMLRNWDDRTERMALLLRSAMAVVVVVVGLKLVYHVSGHDKYRADSLHMFLVVLARCASWPNIRSELWWMVNWAPWATLVVMYLLRKVEDLPWIRFAMAMGVWVVLQEVATAYSRSPLALSSRYSDPISIGFAVNVLAAIIIFYHARQRLKKIIVIFTLCWMMPNTWFLVKITADNLASPLPERKRVFGVQISKTAAYLRTGNLQVLVPQHKYDIPYRDVDEYARLLTDPVLRPILPRSVNGGYDTRATLSRMSDFLLKLSRPLQIAGTTMLLMMLFFLWVKMLKRLDD